MIPVPEKEYAISPAVFPVKSFGATDSFFKLPVATTVANVKMYEKGLYPLCYVSEK
jgi:hypothetical protein